MPAASSYALGGSGQDNFPAFAQGVIISALVGGTSSVLSGGKFANGAKSGAIVYALNSVADKEREVAQKVKSDLLKGEVEIELNGYIKGKLSSGGIELSVDLGAASVSFDQDGKISGTYGFVKGEGQFSGLGAKLTSLGIDIRGAQFTLSDFSSTSLS
ncbi:hypothetical protein [Agarilytica rhodophyticola]|uniref:hypothetical protein n=1 Tax=Agarilytica rhodophyticola TaxID=1737490 RepID=UPI000B347455|nr:hypothetical protein [Agarilytica rhodophyticola]